MGSGRGRIVTLTGLAAVALSCGQREQSPPPDQAAPSWEVELFASGVVSTEAPEFATSFTSSGDTVFFNRTPPDRSRLDLYYSVRTNGEWSDATLFEPLAGVSAIDPFVSLDGERLYFSSDLEGTGTLAAPFNLWWIPLGSVASEPTPLPAPINSDSSEVFNSFARDGRMVFSSRRDGVRAIYEVAAGDAEVARIELAVGGDGSASNPAIHPSGRLLVFASSASGETPDLFVSCRDGGTWGAPQRLASPVNTPFTEFAPGFGPGFLYFSSERPGIVESVADGVRPPGDIYRTPVTAIERLCPGGTA